MLYHRIAIAAFIALASEVVGAPVKSAKPFVFKGNDKNILVYGTATGGDGGQNVAYTNGAAVPIVINGGYKGSGSIVAGAYQANTVSQSANGGGAIVAGVVARDLDDEAMERRMYYYSPPAPVVKGNNKNIVVVGTAHGGDGGMNWASTSGAAAPVVYTDGKGYTYVKAQQSNSVTQNANGGSAIVAGKVARDFDDEIMEKRSYWYSPPAPVVKGNNKNIMVVGTAKGGDGGVNWASTSGAAAPVVYTDGKGYTFVLAEQTNKVTQSADGGSAAVIGKSTKRSEIEQRTCKPAPPVVSHNNGNTQVVGQAIGGNGGFNFANTVGVAVPVVIGGNPGSVIASNNNNVAQNANGGGAVVAGKLRRDLGDDEEDEDFQEEEDEEHLMARKFTMPTFYGNKGNTVVYGSATGGNGGWNEASTSGSAVPVFISDGYGWSGGHVNVAAVQANTVTQSANGGSAAVIGKSG